MNYLLVNTANDELVIVLNKDGTIFACNERNVKKHNEMLLPKLDEVLSSAGVTLNDIDEFGVVVGPGSFTGIRVGIATIKAFKDVTNKPVRAINNLDLLYQIAKVDGFNVVAIEGSLNSYFVAQFDGVRLNIYERNLTIDELTMVANGKNVAMYKNSHNFELGKEVEFDNNSFIEAFNNSKTYDLTPVYYQLSQAENDKIDRANIVIREAELYDIKAICEMSEKNFLIYPTTSLNKKIIDKNCITYVAQLDEQVVGFITSTIDNEHKEIYVNLIVVETNFRNHGIGSKLIESVEILAKENKYEVSIPIWKDCFTLETLCKKLGYIDIRKGVNKNLLDKFKSAPEELYQYSVIKSFK